MNSLIELDEDGVEIHCERCGAIQVPLDHDNLCEKCQIDIYGKELL